MAHFPFHHMPNAKFLWQARRDFEQCMVGTHCSVMDSRVSVRKLYRNLSATTRSDEQNPNEAVWTPCSPLLGSPLLGSPLVSPLCPFPIVLTNASAPSSTTTTTNSKKNKPLSQYLRTTGPPSPAINSSTCTFDPKSRV